MQYLSAIKEINEYMILDLKDCKTWYMLVRNIAGTHDEYKDAEFLFRIELNDKDPVLVPPKFFALTPNGVYAVNELPCIGTGIYHANDYSAAGGIARFLREIINGLIVYDALGGGINLIHKSTTLEQKRNFAQKSKAYNREHNNEIIENMRASFNKYSRHYWFKKFSRNYSKEPELAGKYVNSQLRSMNNVEEYIKYLEWNE